MKLDLTDLANSLARIKGVEVKDIISSLEKGVVTAIKRDYPEGAILFVQINQKTGDIMAGRGFLLVDQVENIETQMLSNEVENERIHTLVKDGVEHTFAIEPIEINIDRQKLNIIKQVSMRDINLNSFNSFVENLLDRHENNQLFIGKVRGSRKDAILLDFQGQEILLPRRNLIGREYFRNGSSVPFVFEFSRDRYVATRNNNDFITQSLKRDLYDIESGHITINRIARIPGFRTKVAVSSPFPSYDPVKRCIQQVSKKRSLTNEGFPEFIEFVQYSEDLATFAANSIPSYTTLKIFIDEDNNTLTLTISDEEYKNFHTYKQEQEQLLSELLDMNVKVISLEIWEQQQQQSNNDISSMLSITLNCEQEVAELLVENRFLSLDDVAYEQPSEFGSELTDSEINKLQKAALQVLTLNPLLPQSVLDLLNLNLTKEQVSSLLDKQIFNTEQLSDLATDELLEYIPSLTEEQASKTIVNARKAIGII